jgi:hypothetical protein
MDSLGTLIQSVPASAGYSFDHSEWVSGTSNLVVASLSNGSGAHLKLVLINLSDGSLVELAEGDELWHPSLWVNSNVVSDDVTLLDLDSAGVYYVGGQAWMHEALGFKMTQTIHSGSRVPAKSTLS